MALPGVNEIKNATIQGQLQTLLEDLRDVVAIVQMASVTFDVAQATLNADDGSGIKIESIDLPFDAKILRAFVDITQGDGSGGPASTVGLIINNTDDAVTPVTTLVVNQGCAQASLLSFIPASSITVPLATVTATNRYVLVIFKDTGDEGNSSADLQGTLFVEYVEQ